MATYIGCHLPLGTCHMHLLFFVIAVRFANVAQLPPLLPPLLLPPLLLPPLLLPPLLLPPLLLSPSLPCLLLPLFLLHFIAAISLLPLALLR
ncbi:MAG: hypothetical protein FWE54_03415 [Methanimicrococcus sp.]|nr:hypothetical protein [Methanimicrococcus sp.]